MTPSQPRMEQATMINRRQFTSLATVGVLAGCATQNKSNREHPMITHSVFFKLHHPAGSAEEKTFLTNAAALASIPGVQGFQILNETSPKNDFDFGLTMTFADQAAYDAYNHHPAHVAFVEDVWLKEVADFMEIDHIPHP